MDKIDAQEEGKSGKGNKKKREGDETQPDVRFSQEGNSDCSYSKRRTLSWKYQSIEICQEPMEMMKYVTLPSRFCMQSIATSSSAQMLCPIILSELLP